MVVAELCHRKQKIYNAEKLNIILKFTIICWFLDLCWRSHSVSADTTCQCQDFQKVFKICCIYNRNNVAQKLKQITDIHPNKIESEKKI